MEDGEQPTSGSSPAATDTHPRAGTGVTIARNSLWLMVDSVVGMFVSFYCSIMAARRLGPDFMGHYNYILYFSNVLRMVTEIAIPATVRKFAAELSGREDFGAVKQLVRRMMRLQAKLAFVGVTAGLLIVHKFFDKEQQLVATLAVLAILPGMFLSTPTGALWATGNMRHNVMSSLIASTVNVVGVTVVLLMDWGLVGLMGSLLFSRLVDFCVRFMIFRREYARLPGEASPGPLPVELRARMIPFAAQQLILALLGAVLFDRMEVFILQKYAPAREIAFFSISLTLVQYLLLIPQNLAGSASVNTWTAQGRDPREAVRTTATATWFIFLFAAPQLFGVAALSDPLLRLMYGAKYLPAIPVLTVLSLCALFVAVAKSTQDLLVGSERQKFYIVWMSVVGVVDLASNFVLVPRYGAMGAAYAKGATQILAGLGFLTYLVVHFKASLPLARAARLLVACVAMFFAVRAIELRLHPLLALIVGIPVGATIFVVLLRALRCLDEADGGRLRRLQRMVPGRARARYLRLVDFVAPTVTAQPAGTPAAS